MQIEEICKRIEAVIMRPLETLEKVATLDEMNISKCEGDGYWSLI